MRRILSYLRKYTIQIFVSIIMTAVYVVLSLLIPIKTGYAVDLAIETGLCDIKGVTDIALQIAMMGLLAASAQYLSDISAGYAAHSCIKDLRIQATNKINTAKIKQLDIYSHGDISNRIINDTELISEGLILGFRQLFSGILTILGTIIIMLKMNAVVTLSVIILTPLSLLVASFISKRTFSFFTRRSENQSRLLAFTQENVAHRDLILSYGKPEINERQFQELNAELRECSKKALFISSVTNPATRFVNTLIYIAVGMLGSYMVITGRMSIGAISAFLVYSNKYAKPFNEISDVIAEFQSALAGAKRVFQIIDMEDEPHGELPAVPGDIEFKNVCFSYSDKKLFEGLNLYVKKGQRIAIVGPTGCGKTTLINLLMRFYTVNSGEILLSGQNINDLSQDSLRQNIGMVLQDTWLKNATIRENIRYSKPDATDDEIVEAAKRTNAYSFIKKLPQGLDTVLGEDVAGISEGQRQLLCITRLMLSPPPILILDEATSSIDAQTEQLVYRAFDKLMTGRTTFAVAHRLKTVIDSDLILVMDKGKIVESGSHLELLRNKGFYYNLYCNS